MPSGRLLIVAPDRELRESLAFALEAEGYTVCAEDTLPDPTNLAAKCFDCAVLDQKAMAGRPTQPGDRLGLPCPVVLLAANPRGWHGHWVNEVVEMPLSENSVSNSVRRLIAR